MVLKKSCLQREGRGGEGGGKGEAKREKDIRFCRHACRRACSICFLSYASHNQNLYVPKYFACEWLLRFHRLIGVFYNFYLCEHVGPSLVFTKFATTITVRLYKICITIGNLIFVVLLRACKVHKVHVKVNTNIAVLIFIIRLTHASVWGSMEKPCNCTQFIKSCIFKLPVTREPISSTASHARTHTSTISQTRICVRYCKSCALHLNVQWNRRFVWWNHYHHSTKLYWKKNIPCLLPLALLLIPHTCNNADGDELVIFSLYYGDSYIFTPCNMIDIILDSLVPRPHPWGEGLVTSGWFLGLH